MTAAAEAAALVAAAEIATAGAPNEASLRHELENGLEVSCRRLGVPWTPFRIDLALPAFGGSTHFADVVHGAVVIEYEPPRSLRGRDAGMSTRHARAQACDYVARLGPLEGRPLEYYEMVVWDGSHITFGKHQSGVPVWSTLQPFNFGAALRLLDALGRLGQPLVSAPLVRSMFGPESDLGVALVPLLFSVAQASLTSGGTTRTKLLFTEWRRLFSQAVGLHTDRLEALAAQMGNAQGVDYSSDPDCWLFALSTHVAVVAKVVAALALPGAAQDIADGSVAARQRLLALEDGRLFRGAGVANLLSGDFFAWYLDFPGWSDLEPTLELLLAGAVAIDFGPAGDRVFARDLFKGLYEDFVPAAVRHSLGEYNTPDWLAEHIVDQSGWQPDQTLTDPTCGTGTFLLEALRRRLVASTGTGAGTDASGLLQGLAGFDINPLAVLAARASIVVALRDRLDPAKPCHLPVYLADTINPARQVENAYDHAIQTDRGVRRFLLPVSLSRHGELSALFGELRLLVEADLQEDELMAALEARMPSVAGLDPQGRDALRVTVASMVDLQAQGWNGIWCSILSERFSAAATPTAQVVMGNAPWVRWSNLPPEYADFVKAYCADLGLLSDARWVGGIESDICTLVFHRAAEWCLAERGLLVMLMTGSVFTTESAQGFRRFRPGSGPPLKVLAVEDFREVAPFEGVSNHPILVVARSGEKTSYPVPYTVWTVPPGRRGRRYLTASAFKAEAAASTLDALPVPGTDGGPWLKGTTHEITAWKTLYEGGAAGVHQARKGVTTDLNGVFWVTPLGFRRPGGAIVRNNPKAGRKSLPTVKHEVEAEHLFPLLRGRGVNAFRAIPDDEYLILMPQRGMHGNPGLPAEAPRTFEYLLRFKELLEARSSYRRFQRSQPWWSVWSTGEYTFADWKVVWREFAAGRFVAAVVGPVDDLTLGPRPVIPDHKLYFLPCATAAEAHFACGVLNAPTVASAISSYAAQFSLGVSATKYLHLPAWDPMSAIEAEISGLAASLHMARPGQTEYDELDALVGRLFGYG